VLADVADNALPVASGGIADVPNWLGTARLPLSAVSQALSEASAAEAGITRQRHRLRAIGHTDLAEDEGNMVSHCLLGDLELRRDAAVVQSQRQNVQDFALARGEVAQRYRV